MTKQTEDEILKDLYKSYERSFGIEISTEFEKELKIDLITPKKIVKELDETVIGQSEAKQLIAIAAFNRLLSMNNEYLKRKDCDYFFEKNNIMLIGNTGCGKTHLIKALSEVVQLPVTIQDATSFTSAGYVGRDVDQCLDSLYDAATKVFEEKYKTNALTYADRDEMITKICEYGIIYIDEADKIRTNTGLGKDVNGRSVQEAFLKLLEGEKVKLKKGLVIDTKNILFIFGGAFSDLPKIVERRKDSSGIGFNAKVKDTGKKSNILKQATVADFTEFGIIPELIGRLPTVAVLNELTDDMVYRIFTEPRYSIMSQVINEFKSYGANVSFTKDAIQCLVKEALEMKIGARGLKAVCQKALRPLFYYLPDNPSKKEIIISKKLLNEIKRMPDA